MQTALQALLIIFISCGCTYSQVNCDTIIPPPAQSNYILPYPPGKTYCIIQGNCSPVGGHANLFAYDFNTQTGDTIVASRAGIVVFVNEQYSDSDWVNGHENNVFIQHIDGTRIRYTHLKQFGVIVETGNIVQAGQPIALSGSSGNTGGVPHLHLQAFRNGSSYNGFNSVPLNFSNNGGPVNSQNLCIASQCYTAIDPLVSVSSITNERTAGFELGQNYPNPFNPSTIIPFSIRYASLIKLTLFDILGNEAAVLIDGRMQPGSYELTWSPADLPGGVYYYVLISGELKRTGKLVLLR